MAAWNTGEREAFGGMTQEEYEEEQEALYNRPKCFPIPVEDRILQKIGVELYLEFRDAYGSTEETVFNWLKAKLTEKTKNSEFYRPEKVSNYSLKYYHRRCIVLAKNDKEYQKEEKEFEEKQNQIFKFMKEKLD